MNEKNKSKDEELIGVLMAISVVSKRLARDLIRLQQAQEQNDDLETKKDGGFPS